MHTTRARILVACVAAAIIIGLVTWGVLSNNNTSSSKTVASVYPERGYAVSINMDKTTGALSCDTATVASIKLVPGGTVGNNGLTTTMSLTKTTVLVTSNGQTDYVSGIAFGDKGAAKFNIPPDTRVFSLNIAKDFGGEVGRITGITLCGGGA